MAMTNDQKLMSHAYMQLAQPKDRVQCQYVWIDGSLKNFRSKSKTWFSLNPSVEDLPWMEFCGSATDFDVGNLADYYAKPVRIFKDPFRGGNNKLVFCETYSREGLPTFANNRFRLLNAEKQNDAQQVNKFAFQQPYKLLRKDGKSLSYLDPAYIEESKADFCCGKEIVESHYRVCLYAGVDLTSSEPINREGQWMYQIGPSAGVELSDNVWMSRFLLLRVAEDFGVSVSFDGLSASFHLETAHLTLEDRQRMTEAFLKQFIAKESKAVKILSRHKNVIISNLNSDIDTYSFTTKVLEALRDNRTAE